MKVIVKSFMKFTALKGVNMKEMSALLKSVAGKTADVEASPDMTVKDFIPAARSALGLSGGDYDEVYLEVASERKLAPEQTLASFGIKEGHCVSIVFFKRVN